MQTFDIYRSEPIDGHHHDFDYMLTVRANDPFSAMREGRERAGYTPRDPGLWEARPATSRVTL